MERLSRQHIPLTYNADAFIGVSVKGAPDHASQHHPHPHPHPHLYPHPYLQTHYDPSVPSPIRRGIIVLANNGVSQDFTSNYNDSSSERRFDSHYCRGGDGERCTTFPYEEDNNSYSSSRTSSIDSIDILEMEIFLKQTYYLTRPRE